MSLPALDNPVRIGQLKTEPRNEAETKRMLAMARTDHATLCAVVHVGGNKRSALHRMKKQPLLERVLFCKT